MNWAGDHEKQVQGTSYEGRGIGTRDKNPTYEAIASKTHYLVTLSSLHLKCAQTIMV
jgi:hypothetical protein